MVSRLSKSRSEVVVESIKKKTSLQRESIVWAWKGLAWVLEKTMRMAERYWQWLMRNLLRNNVELVTRGTLEPTDRGFKLTLEVDIPDQTVIYFAQHIGELEKLVRSKKASIKIAKYMRKMRKEGKRFGGKKA